MKEFEFYQDVKVTVWQRQYISVKAESKEEALKMVEKYKTHDASGYLMPNNTEYLYDTEELMSPEENGGYTTIELYDKETEEMIGCNGIH